MFVHPMSAISVHFHVYVKSNQPLRDSLCYIVLLGREREYVCVCACACARYEEERDKGLESGTVERKTGNRRDRQR